MSLHEDPRVRRILEEADLKFTPRRWLTGDPDPNKKKDGDEPQD